MEIFSSLKYLVGTIAIPNAFPELATIQSHAQARLIGGGALDNVLQIIERKPQWTIVRTVSVRDVIAVFTTTETNPGEIRRDWLNAKNWITGKRSIRDIKGTQTGIAYVSDRARVIMNIEFGMTAADSAEYYPPVFPTVSSPGIPVSGCLPCCGPVQCEPMATSCGPCGNGWSVLIGTLIRIGCGTRGYLVLSVSSHKWRLTSTWWFLVATNRPWPPRSSAASRPRPTRGWTIHRVTGPPRPDDANRWQTIARARNQGKSKGQSEWLMFLDDDVALAPGCVARLWEELQRRPAFGALAADYLGESGTDAPPRHVGMGATLFRRAALREIHFRWRPGDANVSAAVTTCDAMAMASTMCRRPARFIWASGRPMVLNPVYRPIRRPRRQPFRVVCWRRSIVFTTASSPGSFSPRYAPAAMTRSCWSSGMGWIRANGGSWRDDPTSSCCRWTATASTRPGGASMTSRRFFRGCPHKLPSRTGTPGT